LYSDIPITVPFLLAMAAIVIARLGRAWLRYRGTRLITCPENRRPAGVKVDAFRAAASGFFHPEQLRLSHCSRWPAQRGCGQSCVSQIVAVPEACRVRNVVNQWYVGRLCASCGRPFHKTGWMTVTPALLNADKTTVEWKQIPVAELPEKLKTG
jgi:hypothetical protein